MREKRGHCTDGGYCVTPRRCFPVGLHLLVVHTARGAGARASVLSVFVSLTSVLSVFVSLTSVLSVFVSLTSVLSAFVSLIYVCQSDLCPVCVCQPDFCSNTKRFKRTLIYFNTDTH